MRTIPAVLLALTNIIIFACILWALHQISRHSKEQKEIYLQILNSQKALSERLKGLEASNNRTSANDKEKGVLKILSNFFGSKSATHNSGDHDQELIGILQHLADKNQTCLAPISHGSDEGQSISNLFSFVLLAAGFTFLFRLAYSEYIAFQCMKDDEEVERVNGRRHHSVSIGEFMKYR